MKFYKEIDSKHYAVVVDCYAKIFLCDFINCIITIFTYQYFGVTEKLNILKLIKGFHLKLSIVKETARSAAGANASVVTSIQDNKVSLT
jgi:hypothetical protein